MMDHVFRPLILNNKHAIMVGFVWLIVYVWNYIYTLYIFRGATSYFLRYLSSMPLSETKKKYRL